jgi:transcriptional regulator with XRE-family HTH domain
MNLQDKRFLQALGDRIREIRTEAGMTQEELGKKCDLHRTFIGSVERGERNVSILNLKQIARFLKTPLASLFDDAPPRNES